MQTLSNRTGVVVLAIAFLMAAAVLAAWLLRRSFKKNREERNKREINRALAEAGAQEALNALYRKSRGMFGDNFAALQNRLNTTLKRLTDADRPMVTRWIPSGYPALIEAARDYTNIFEGRAVVDENVSVYPYNVAPGSFTIGAYDVIVSAASSLRGKLEELQQVIAEIQKFCDRIDSAGVSARRNLSIVESTRIEAHASISQLEAEGYGVKTLRNRLKTARGYLTRAEAAINEGSFFTAMNHITAAEKWIIDAEDAVENMPRIRQELETRLASLEADVTAALARIATARAMMTLLGARYLAVAIKPARETLNQAIQLGAQLTETAEQFKARLTALDIPEAADLADNATALIREITEAHQQIAALPGRLLQQRSDARTANANLESLIAEVRARISSRQGRQRRYLTRISELETLTAAQSRNLVRNPGAALAQLGVIDTQVRACDRNSQNEHDRTSQDPRN